MAEASAERLAETFVRAWKERKPELLTAFCDREIEFLLPRNLLEGGSYKGHEGVSQAMADGYESWRSFDGEVKSVREVGDRIVLQLRSIQLARHGGPRVEYDLSYVCEMRNGLILRARPFLNHEEALEAAGLSE